MEFLIIIVLLVAQRFWWQTLPLASWGGDQWTAVVSDRLGSEPSARAYVSWVLLPSALVFLLALALDDLLMGFAAFILTGLLVLIAIESAPSGPFLDQHTVASDNAPDLDDSRSDYGLVHHMCSLHRELFAPLLLLLVLGIWAVVAWRLHGWFVSHYQRREVGGELMTRLEQVLPGLDSLALRVSLFVLVFWRGFGVVWTLFLQSLETWQVDLEVSLASVWEQVQHRGPGAEGRSADDPAEQLLNRLLLGWAGMTALFEIVFS